MLTTIAGVKLHKFEFRWSLIRGRPFFFIITSVQNVRWAEGVQDRCTLFPKFNDDIISAKSSFCFFYLYAFGGGRVLAERVRFGRS